MIFLQLAALLLAAASCVLSFLRLPRRARVILGSAEGARVLAGVVSSAVLRAVGASRLSSISDESLREWASDTENGSLWVLFGIACTVSALCALAVLLTGDRFSAVKRIRPPAKVLIFFYRSTLASRYNGDKLNINQITPE